ncbi:MAG: aldo/keto reductase [Myxococcota bacterium]
MRLGRREHPVPYTLGCMNFGKRTDADESLRIVDAAVDAGLTLLDTANAYNGGESERIVGRALARHPSLKVATKVGFGRIDGALEGLRPDHIIAACEASLQRLNVETIDLYYLHLPDYSVPIADSLGAMARLMEAGKIREVGVSNFASWQVLQMHQSLRPAVAQHMYNPLIRQLDVEWFQFAQAFPIHTTVYNPLAGGLLTGQHSLEAGAVPGGRFDKNPLYEGRYWRSAMFEGVDALSDVARAEGISLLQLAYAFVLRHPGVDSVLIGPGTQAHLQDALSARQVVLSTDALARIDEVYVNLVGTDATYAR